MKEGAHFYYIGLAQGRDKGLVRDWWGTDEGLLLTRAEIAGAIKLEKCIVLQNNQELIMKCYIQ